mgnify:CR=1 FL=1
MSGKTISASTEIWVEFYDVDSMNIVWHGNYIKYFEVARCVLLDKIQFGYNEIAESGYAWPVVDVRVKYIRPLRFKQKAVIEATLLEWENRLRIKYVITDSETGAVLTKGESTQMAVEISTMTSCFVSPECLTSKVEECLMLNEDRV